jgi:hypothetical protein
MLLPNAINAFGKWTFLDVEVFPRDAISSKSTRFLSTEMKPLVAFPAFDATTDEHGSHDDDDALQSNSHLFEHNSIGFRNIDDREREEEAKDNGSAEKLVALNVERPLCEVPF